MAPGTQWDTGFTWGLLQADQTKLIALPLLFGFTGLHLYPVQSGKGGAGKAVCESDAPCGNTGRNLFRTNLHFILGEKRHLWGAFSHRSSMHGTVERRGTGVVPRVDTPFYHLAFAVMTHVLCYLLKPAHACQSRPTQHLLWRDPHVSESSHCNSTNPHTGASRILVQE